MLRYGRYLEVDFRVYSVKCGCAGFAGRPLLGIQSKNTSFLKDNPLTKDGKCLFRILCSRPTSQTAGSGIVTGIFILCWQQIELKQWTFDFLLS